MSAVQVLAAGNEMRGDDAAGPRLAAFIEAMALPVVRVLHDFQFQVEHAVDLSAADLAIFIDAHATQTAPLTFTELTDSAVPHPGSHALAPAEVVGVARRLALPVPPVFVLAVAGRQFALGAPMSGECEAACEAAQRLLADLLMSPSAALWRAQACRRVTPA